MKTHEKTILVKTCGNPEIGMGHVYRSLALSRALEKDYKVLFNTNSVPEVQGLVKKQGIKCFEDETEQKVIKNEKVDLLLYDQLYDDKGLFKTLKNAFPNLKVLALDYFNYENAFVDTIINLFNQNLEASKPVDVGVKYYEGLKYAIIREEFKNYTSKLDIKDISKVVRQVLVTFGGVDSRKNTGRALQLLEMSGLEDIKVDVILGPLWKGELPAVNLSNINFHFSIPSSQMPNFMVEADVTFCGAGTTLMELLYLGIPTVILPQNQFEKRFAQSIAQRGAVRLINVNSLEQETHIISNLFNLPQERAVLRHQGKMLVDGKGTERIYHIINRILYH